MSEKELSNNYPVVVDSKGRILIPNPVRKHFRMKQGTTFILSISTDKKSIVLTDSTPVICPKCHKVFSKLSNYCDYCGTKLKKRKE